ncbi:MAG: ABC transporter substrate-binding protein [Planctomycetota bacterium]
MRRKLTVQTAAQWLPSIGGFVRCAAFAALMLCGVLVQTEHANAQWLKKGYSELKRPLIDGTPFDLLVLNKNGEEAILKIKPLGDAMPKFPLETRGQLIFELFAGLDEKLEVPYNSIERIETYNDLLVSEAEGWIDSKQYAKAFRNLLYVYDNGGKSDRQLVDTLTRCMFLDATQNFKAGEFELSLTMFEDIYARDPNLSLPDFKNTKLIEIILQCYNGIIQKKFDAEEYLTVRNNVASVVKKYPDDAVSLKQFWEKAFLARSNELLEKSKRLAVDGKGREAHLAARQADQMVPDRPEVMAHQEKLLQQYPLIIVGVSESMSDANPSRIENWGARRVGRLTKRMMVEMTGLSDEGGKYTFLNGTMERIDDAGMQYTLELNGTTSRFAVPPIDSYEVSMRLLELGRPDSPIYNQAWAKVIDRVYVEDEKRITFKLRTPVVRPEALLQVPYHDDGVQNGAYVLAGETEGISTFELNPLYEPVEGRQHPVIIEQKYGAASSAVDDLERGNIDVVDRVSTADVARLKENPDIVVRSYILPSVHFLVPKIRHDELKDNLFFRSGLSHTINRRQIVDEVMSGGTVVSGSEPLSGPFPIGSDTNDQISYGSDMRAKPLAFNTELGMVLIQLSLQADPPRRPEPLPPPTLVLAHPRSSSARNAASAIARAWSQAGVPTSTRELKDGMTLPPDDEWDFLYMEIVVEEPLADASKMIGVHGFAKIVSAPVEQTLRLLDYARSWQAACSALRRLHRQIRVDLSVIPLWQITENYAYRNTIRNVGRDLIHLYQNVDRWKIDLRAEEEEENE